ncbi:glycosylphosphatidylinositol-alpha 1,4 mannosyltransferase I Ecym_8267 [Eremothecium cymbalariae DBVPG|uniref:GPI mannosyltransferase 1 n=1 Tax=Eremothecium cymbalariae (strain CBS 270.75 / DBVPG 7215 / KCTC 17166 / NRRL Y-17582) TaxID=931890 RepID=G8JXH5_ERECY|nr:Hypothetical protein Ecym_8267 [Eremothecium cymbalariae DBVPG\
MNRDLKLLIFISFIARVLFFQYGVYQDSHFVVKYTDVDYYVFHDAANYVFQNVSPYLRDTYRYTPLLSWILVPNHWLQWIHFGKLVFTVFDLLTGIMILQLLTDYPLKRRIILSSIWLLNPMVITISTRGNAESILCFLVVWFLYHLKSRQYALSGMIYGLVIHFKIYPIIYAPAISIYFFRSKDKDWFKNLFIMGVTTLISFLGLGMLMYHFYGNEFLEHAYIYHVVRTDHRHNFSIWNMLLYLESTYLGVSSSVPWAKYAFIPQFLATMGVTALLWEFPNWNFLLNTMFLQTFTFVTYNKVCTSQYFVWYLILLPFYLAETTLTWTKGVFIGILWVASQILWLYHGYLLEFEGRDVFYPGIFFSSVVFFLANIYLLSVFIIDCKNRIHFATAKKEL